VRREDGAEEADRALAEAGVQRQVRERAHDPEQRDPHRVHLVEHRYVGPEREQDDERDNPDQLRPEQRRRLTDAVDGLLGEEVGQAPAGHPAKTSDCRDGQRAAHLLMDG
jgi:hypothetical protein